MNRLPARAEHQKETGDEKVKKKTQRRQKNKARGIRR
jgi:hypothetical protein